MSVRKTNKNPRQVNPKMLKTYDTMFYKADKKTPGFKFGTGKKVQIRKTGKR